MDVSYFSWLCEHVYPYGNGRTWDILLKILYDTPFKALIPNDMNRCSDGIVLRNEYLMEVAAENSHGLEDAPCSVLEIIIALALRMEYELSEPGKPDKTKEYFWLMVRNIGLINYDDATYGSVYDAARRIREILRIFLDRDYTYSGVGGLFPLTDPDKDQRDVEIWYQMNAYLQENYPC